MARGCTEKVWNIHSRASDGNLVQSSYRYINFTIDVLVLRLQQDLTGMDDLGQVRLLEMKVDTRETSLGNLGLHVPNLVQLRLSHSDIASIRYAPFF